MSESPAQDVCRNPALHAFPRLQFFGASLKKRNANARQFVICIDNSSYPASLELHKIYTVLPDEKAAEDDFIRVVDESGEDYLYSTKRFVSVELTVQVKQSIIRKVRETTRLANV